MRFGEHRVLPAHARPFSLELGDVLFLLRRRRTSQRLHAFADRLLDPPQVIADFGVVLRVRSLVTGPSVGELGLELLDPGKQLLDLGMGVLESLPSQHTQLVFRFPQRLAHGGDRAGGRFAEGV